MALYIIIKALTGDKIVNVNAYAIRNKCSVSVAKKQIEQDCESAHYNYYYKNGTATK